jgi:hypothetical protein
MEGSAIGDSVATLTDVRISSAAIGMAEGLEEDTDNRKSALQMFIFY